MYETKVTTMKNNNISTFPYRATNLNKTILSMDVSMQLKCVLFAYATYANPDGSSIFVSNETMQKELKCSPAMFKRYKKALLDSGVLLFSHMRGHVACYKLNLPGDATPSYDETEQTPSEDTAPLDDDLFNDSSDSTIVPFPASAPALVYEETLYSKLMGRIESIKRAAQAGLNNQALIHQAGRYGWNEDELSYFLSTPLHQIASNLQKQLSKSQYTGGAAN